MPSLSLPLPALFLQDKRAETDSFPVPGVGDHHPVSLRDHGGIGKSAGLILQREQRLEGTPLIQGYSRRQGCAGPFIITRQVFPGIVCQHQRAVRQDAGVNTGIVVGQPGVIGQAPGMAPIQGIAAENAGSASRTTGGDQ